MYDTFGGQDIKRRQGIGRDGGMQLLNYVAVITVIGWLDLEITRKCYLIRKSPFVTMFIL